MLEGTPQAFRFSHGVECLHKTFLIMERFWGWAAHSYNSNYIH